MKLGKKLTVRPHRMPWRRQGRRGMVEERASARTVTLGWSKGSREVVESPSLEIFKTRLDKVLCSLL